MISDCQSIAKKTDKVIKSDHIMLNTATWSSSRGDQRATLGPRGRALRGLGF